MIIKVSLLLGLLAQGGASKYGYVTYDNGVAVPIWIVGFVSMSARDQIDEYDFLDMDQKLDLALYGEFIPQFVSSAWRFRILNLGPPLVPRLIKRLRAENQDLMLESIFRQLRVCVNKFKAAGMTDTDVVLIRNKMSEIRTRNATLEGDALAATLEGNDLLAAIDIARSRR